MHIVNCSGKETWVLRRTFFMCVCVCVCVYMKDCRCIYKICSKRKWGKYEYATLLHLIIQLILSKTNPDNYRGITLLNTALKLFTKVILSKLLNYIQPREEQQGFRKNRSTTDAIFILRQIVEKSIQFNHPTYLCFVELKKSFWSGEISRRYRVFERTRSTWTNSKDN